MFERRIPRRTLVSLAALTLLGACQLIPGRPKDQPPTPPPGAGSNLPADSGRHRVALLVPMSGPNGMVGRSLANAATMALLDTNAANIRLTTYDTAAGAAEATGKALADGNRLILGPLTNEELGGVSSRAHAARVPVISFASEGGGAGRDVFALGLSTEQTIARTVGHARARGMIRFAALVPRGDYGQRAASAMAQSVRQSGGLMVGSETFDRGNPSVISAARRLKTRGGYDAVLIADGGRIAIQAAPLLRPGRVLGPDLWSGDAAVAKSPALEGAWFSSVADGRFRQFSASYRARFGAQPFRVATLGYDAVLLTLRVARDWPVGKPFPVTQMLDRGGFLGLDGPFRFGRGGVAERALEVREVRKGRVGVVSPAPDAFAD